MAHEIPARLTPGELRRFALTVGAAFLVLGGLSLWRGHTAAPLVLAGIGAALGLAGLAIPARLGPLYRGWMRLGLFISKLTTPLLLGLVYFGLITPMGLLRRLAGRDPLRHRAGERGYWKAREPAPADRARTLERQF